MGWFGPTTEGTPQGGPLSPLLSNLMLDVLDKELEKRGHRFVRYADDCNIYVRSRRAGERVMASVTRFLARRLHAFTELPAPPAAVCGSASSEPLPAGVERPAIDILFAMLKGHMGRDAA